MTTRVDWQDVLLPAHWELWKLSRLTKCLDGQRVPVSSEIRATMQGDIPYWGAGGVVDHVDSHLFDETLVLLGEDGAPFFDSTRPVAYLVDGPTWINNHIHVLRPNSLVDPQYLVHALNTVDYSLHIDGSTRDKLTQGAMNAIRVPLPPLSAQRRVVDYLDSETARIDTLIDRKQRFVDLLLEKRTALITHAVTKGLDPDAEMKESGTEWLGRVPASWRVQPLKRLVHVCQNGCWGEEPGVSEVDVSCVRAADFDRPAMSVDVSRLPLRSLTRREWGKNRIRRDDLVIEKSGGGDDQPVGKVVHFAHEDIDAVCSNFQARIVLEDQVEPMFATYLFEALYSIGVNRRHIKQTTGLQNLDVKAYFAENVPTPDAEEQARIAHHITKSLASYDATVDRTRRSIDLLREYRTALISAAVTGQIDIPGADASEEVA